MRLLELLARPMTKPSAHPSTMQISVRFKVVSRPRSSASLKRSTILKSKAIMSTSSAGRRDAATLEEIHELRHRERNGEIDQSHDREGFDRPVGLGCQGFAGVHQFRDSHQGDQGALLKGAD